MITTRQAASAANITGAQVCYLLRKYPARFKSRKLNRSCILIEMSVDEFLSVYAGLPKVGQYERNHSPARKAALAAQAAMMRSRKKQKI